MIVLMRCLLLVIVVIATLTAADAPTPTWADEFDTPGAPDPAKWDYEVGLVRNKEVQFYTRDRRENARVADGHLIITARKEAWNENGKTAAYTSASLRTRGRRDFTFGRLEVRAKLPAGRGMWPAIWFMGSDKSRGWPACGEIDLMEYVGFDPDRLHFNIHCKAYNHVAKTGKGAAIPVPAAANDWHTYVLERHVGTLAMQLDGKEVFRFADEGKGLDTWPFDLPQYLILNVAIGGSWGGQQGIDDAVFPQEMRVDYVRYWQTER